MIQQKPIFEKTNMAAVITIIINNLQLKYRKVCAGRNLLGRSFSFSTWNLPIMMQQKPIFQIQKKSNTAAVIAIIIDNLQIKYRKVCAGRNLWGRSFSFSTWNLPIMLQQQPIFFKFSKKSSMAININNLLLKYWKACTVQHQWAGSFHFHCACYQYLDNKNSYFKFASNLILSLLQAIIIDNFHLDYWNMSFHPQGVRNSTFSKISY